MKTQSIYRLAPCMVAACLVIGLPSAYGQENVVPEPTPMESGSYVGDSSCSSCGSVVSDDGGLLHGACPHCGGRLLGGHLANVLHGHHVGDGRIHDRGYGRPDLFYNYYTQGYANRLNAQMYLSPVPVPPNVGHTFYTYQPFLPHHLLYPHVDKYHRYYDCGRGMNRTRASYWTSVHAKAKNIYWNYFRLPR